jgi:tetratricopeptide (TPR) repeat protein
MRFRFYAGGISPWPASWAALPLALLVGCATVDQSARNWPRTGDALVDGRAAIAQGPARDKVLWQCRTAAVALRRGEYAEAKALLDDVLLTIGGISAKDPSARKARGLFRGEAVKTFRGEPYERAMAYFYRGVLYWMDGELDNARACFRSAQFQDSDTENKEYAGDYVLMDYLDGLATVKLGGDGADAAKRAQESAKLFRPPGYDAQANVFVFAEYGHGPTKYAPGQYLEQLRFRAGESAIRSVALKVNDWKVRLEPYDDLNFQATTRGGRVMDHVLGNKAVFKSATDKVGDAALFGGLLLSTQKSTRDAGLGLAAAGLVSKLFSAAANPAADTRSWDNLPQYLSFAAFRLLPGQHGATVEFYEHSSSLSPRLTKNITINVTSAAGNTVVFVSDRN